MSDFNSSLPVRTENPGDVAVFLVDGTTPTQKAAIDTFGSVSSIIKDAAGTAVTTVANGGVQALQVNSQSAGPVSPGTVANFSDLIGGQFNSTLPTLTNGQQAAVQVDNRGRLLTTNSNFPVTVDTNYGTVGANTIRTAAEIGNATGAADFNFGAASAQTLRVAALLGNASGLIDYNFGTVGAQTVRTAAEIGNATGAADFNAGATGAQTLRVTANQGTPGTAANGWFVKVTDGTNTQTVTAGGEALVRATNFPNTVDTNYGTVGANTIRTAAEIGNATGSADFNFGTVGAQTLRAAAQIGNATGAADFNNGATGAQTLRVAANLAVAGANVTATNPVPVTVVNTSLGTEVNKYNTSASVAANASVNHDYTISAGKTFKAKMFWISASGMVKAEVQTSPDGVAFTTYWVGFNSTANPNIDIQLDLLTITDVGAGSKVRIIVTNRDKQSQDVYSTISGSEY